MSRFYITTAIDYVNSLPHLGTAYEKIGADALARFFRMNDSQVYFQMGNDEHSANVLKEATKRSLPPKKYCDEMRKKFETIWESLEISYDNFIQTSEPRHHRSVKAFLGLMDPADISIRPYEGWYCESCEAFLTEKDLVDGKCPTHKTEPKWLKEENYFFHLSRYQEKLLKHYEKHPEFILPEIRRNEIVSLVRSGLQDISISRSGFSWGIPFPNNKNHVVYVWFDALINYLSALGFGNPKKKSLVKKFWPADLHIIGKDITRFHCVIWPAMLVSANLPLPHTVFGHGFIFLKGEKMSKSLGNIVTPLDIVPQYGADALRYYLLRESSFGSDGDFTWDNFIKRYNSDLANDLGNLLNRTLGMTNKYLGGKIPKTISKKPSPEDHALKIIVEGVAKNVRALLDYRKTGDINFHLALATIWEVIGTADKYIDSTAPWKLFKEGKTSEIGKVLYHVVDTIRNVAILVAPFIPGASQKIWKQLGLAKTLKWEKQTYKNVQWGKTPALKVTVGEPIFPRIDVTMPPGDRVDASFRNPPLPQLSGTKVGEEAEGVRAASERGRPSVAETLSPGGSQIRQEKKMDDTNLLDISEFLKADLRIAEVKQAEKVEGADKLLKLQVEVGGEMRQIVAGIALHYKPEELIGKKIVIVANLKQATIRGVESCGMLLAASQGDQLSIVTLDRPDLPTGAKVK